MTPPTDNAILQLADDLHKILNESKLTIDLSKAFDTVDRKIL